MAKQIRFVSQPAIIDGQDVAEVAAFDDAGNPVDITGGSATPTPSPVGAGMLLAGTGVTVTRDDDTQALTIGLAAKGVTTGLIGDTAVTSAQLHDASVIPAKLDATLTAKLAGLKDDGSVADGKVGASALTDAAKAALAYTLPAATDKALGGVRKGAAVPNLAADAPAADIAATVNSLLAQLRAAGVIAA